MSWDHLKTFCPLWSSLQRRPLAWRVVLLAVTDPWITMKINNQQTITGFFCFFPFLPIFLDSLNSFISVYLHSPISLKSVWAALLISVQNFHCAINCRSVGVEQEAVNVVRPHLEQGSLRHHKAHKIVLLFCPSYIQGDNCLSKIMWSQMSTNIYARNWIKSCEWNEWMTTKPSNAQEKRNANKNTVIHVIQVTAPVSLLSRNGNLNEFSIR